VKVILTKDVSALGPAGQVVTVARGYARNFLIPQGKALEATPGNISRFEGVRAAHTAVQEKEREAAAAQAARLEAVSLTISQRVGEGERLYGSVTAAMIADALSAQGFAIDRRQLELPEPIKTLGVHEIAVRLAPQVKAKIKVEVVPQEA
jgi:large subunit ribosomal protein L9